MTSSTGSFISWNFLSLWKTSPADEILSPSPLSLFGFMSSIVEATLHLHFWSKNKPILGLTEVVADDRTLENLFLFVDKSLSL